MEREYILVAKAAENEQRWMPIVINYSKIVWLMYVSADTVVYRLRVESNEMRRLKKRIDDIVLFDELELFEYVEW